METKILDQISDLFNTPFPEADTFEQYLDKIIPMVKANGEDLREEKFYTNKPWVEVQDNESFHELVFHFFSPQPTESDSEDREYLKTVDGEVIQGRWRYVGNKFFIGDSDFDNTKVYELAFMDNEFLILKLLANPKKLKSEDTDKYFVLAIEKIGRKLEWLDLSRHLFEKYQSNNMTFYIIAILIAMIVILIFR